MKSFLHPLFLIVLLLSLPGQVRGQRLCGYLPHSHIYELSAHEAARYSNVAYCFNRTFVGSTLGLNLDSLTRIGGKNPYRVTVTPEPYEAGGVRYASRTDIECKQYRPELVPLASLSEKFHGISYWSHPDLAICIVDNMLVSNPQNVLVDKDYISVIRGFRWDEIECLPPPEIYGRRYASNAVGLIQVYVKKAEYLHDLAHPRII